MKINVQIINDELSEIKGTSGTDFLDAKLRRYYPGPLNLNIQIDKFNNDIRLKIELETIANFQCDCCLEFYEYNLKAAHQQLFQLGSGNLAGSDDVIVLSANTIEIDLDPVLNEIIILNHPFKMLCREDCKGICANCGADLNREACRCTDKPIDPRWEKLRKLIK